jgi:hypothetical protein
VFTRKHWEKNLIALWKTPPPPPLTNLPSQFFPFIYISSFILRIFLKEKRFSLEHMTFPSR